MFIKMTLIAAAITIATPVAAETPPQSPHQVTVSYADLDLATPAGAEALNRRVQAAARSVCPRDPGLAELSRHMISRRCVADATMRTDKRMAEVQLAARQSRSRGRQVTAR